ncbi:MAG: LacI family DNA-binding transcriptional regulator [Betaproteobacteria bacterium]|nr:MAG: LacI family DNA-binding transcriptional regulator [Betaproteobacteria bacterium]
MSGNQNVNVFIHSGSFFKVTKKATIREVASRAKVSLATVSRVFNEPSLVAESTLEGVIRAARELNFRPNQMGRNLRTSRTRNIGVMLPTLGNMVFAECLQGVEAAARERQYGIVLGTTGYRPEEEDAVSEFLLRHRVDGLVLTVANGAKSKVLDKLDKERIPYVLAYNQLSRPGRPTVSVDNRAAARQAIEYLLSLGHRQIRMVAGSFKDSDRAKLRYKGYSEAMRAAGLAPQLPIEIPFLAVDARVHLMEALGTRPRPTALFCSNDYLAMVVIRDLVSMGIRVPGEMSVVGFDGTQAGILTQPVLTSVVQPSQEIGRTAIAVVIAMVEGERSPSSAILHHTLRVGGTTAPVVA